MTEGTSQGLFIVVAIVIFGLFVVMAYILFEDTLSPSLASMFINASEQAATNLNSSLESVLIEPIWERAVSNNGSHYPLLREIRPENGTTYTRITSPYHADIRRLSLNIPFYGEDFNNKELSGKKVKMSLTFRTNANGNKIDFSYFHNDIGEHTVENRKYLESKVVTHTNWQTISKIIDFPYDIRNGHSGYLFIHGGELGDNYFDIKEIRFEIVN